MVCWIGLKIRKLLVMFLNFLLNQNATIFSYLESNNDVLFLICSDFLLASGWDSYCFSVTCVPERFLSDCPLPLCKQQIVSLSTRSSSRFWRSDCLPLLQHHNHFQIDK
jgi:hypothetical protein